MIGCLPAYMHACGVDRGWPAYQVTMQRWQVDADHVRKERRVTNDAAHGARVVRAQRVGEVLQHPVQQPEGLGRRDVHEQHGRHVRHALAVADPRIVQGHGAEHLLQLCASARCRSVQRALIMYTREAPGCVGGSVSRTRLHCRQRTSGAPGRCAERRDRSAIDECMEPRSARQRYEPPRW